MKKYNIFNYIRHKEDIKACMPIDKDFQDYSRNELIIKFKSGTNIKFKNCILKQTFENA